MSKKIAISLLTCNNKELVGYTLDSLVRSDIIKHKLTLFIWVNECTDREGWDKFLSKYSEYMDIVLATTSVNGAIVKPRIVLFNKMFNPSYGMSNKQLYSYPKRLSYNNEKGSSNYDYLLEIHDDMLFPSLWFEGIEKAFTRTTPNGRKPVIVMPFIYTDFEMSESQESIDFKCLSNVSEGVFYKNLVQNHPWVIDFKKLKYYGYYDPDFHPQICEDDDLYFRLILKDEFTITTKESVVMHKKELTRFNKLKMDFKNFSLIKRKHGDFLDNLKNNHLHYDDTDPNLYKGEFAWIGQDLANEKTINNMALQSLSLLQILPKDKGGFL